MTVPAVLRPYVTSLVAYDVDFGAPGVHRGMPSTGTTFVLPVDEPLTTSWGSGTEPVSAWSLVSGLHTRPARIHHSGSQRGVQLALTAAGVRALFAMPAAAWQGELLALDEVTPPGGVRHLPERLAETDPRQWADLVATTLIGALARHGEPSPRAEVGRALALLTGGAGVQQVADEVGYSRRRISDLVRAETGVAPKQFQRLARFDRSRGMVGRMPLAQAATACGYADQAHLTREWQEFAGCAPTTWLREEFPFVQDLADR
ncbi:AraC-like DNA-binding protein [Nocardioides albertanoniae]|uniref:AraC-like DNA-binding protein n=1 Tax=Nocardioides albertanoniae TaxID=1175486 RepID=A0A543A866_9ACTN|nr:helix-turn-helix domain-containing protein [Nocardioides albertanoniae]TQL68719.1 AraC-like DNA-binding protein [Nocardioides albertanoniae]